MARARVKQINWELFDRGIEAFTWYALEELVKAASKARPAERTRRTATKPTASPQEPSRRNWASELDDGALRAVRRAARRTGEAVRATGLPLAAARPGPKGDLVDDEMGRVLQVPGWSNIFTQPIINRIEMLSTGVRTDIGVKVFGPDLDTIDRVCKEIEAALKPINGARDVIAAPIMGKGYLEIDIDREQAARYGISVEDIQNEIEVALAGRAVTYTVEKRDRFPVRIRYARVDREDEESIRRLLVSPGSMAHAEPRQPAMASAGGARDVGADDDRRRRRTRRPRRRTRPRAKPLHPAWARWPTCSIVEGPAMIKSENGRLLNYVTLNVRGRDIVGFVDEAQRVVAQKVQLPEGVHIEWSGEFEHQVRAAQTLRFVFPAVIVLIFVILYLTYNDLADAALMMLAVPEALAGGAFFMYLFPKIMHGWARPADGFQRGRLGRLHRLLRHGDRDRHHHAGLSARGDRKARRAGEHQVAGRTAPGGHRRGGPPPAAQAADRRRGHHRHLSDGVRQGRRRRDPGADGVARAGRLADLRRSRRSVLAGALLLGPPRALAEAAGGRGSFSQ